MRSPLHRFAASLVLFLSAAAVSAASIACGNEREPPDLTQPTRLKSAMWSLASHTNRISLLLEQERELTTAEWAELKSNMDDVGKIAAGLGVDPLARRHPIVTRNLEEFRRAVTLAQAGLASDPPDLAPTRAVAGSCRACHAREKQPVPFDLSP